ncbi:YlmC/YmxH family sporulation protein [Mycoplasmatota bacterium]|nr:YlmC/YmxH family sporulation protein [Mycoplasmatota bacterium]
MGNFVGKILYSDLQDLDVINVVDGSVLGTISDLEIDSTTGRICTITVKCMGKLLKLLNPDKGIIIPWDQIIKIGEDVIIVNYNCLLN